MSEFGILFAMVRELFTLPGLVVMVPLLAASGLGFVRDQSIAPWIGIAAATLAFLLACLLPWQQGAGILLLVDRLSAHMAILTSFVGMTTAWFSRGYVAVELASGRIDAGRLRAYHALFQTYLGFMLLALLSNNLPTTWGAIEAATIASVMVVGLPRTADAVEASWKLFLVCGVGIALAFFGTIVLYLAAQPALGSGLPAMTWNAVIPAAAECRPTLLNLAFVFLLLGYGTKAGLVPLHTWMPDAHAEGPTPVSAVLSGSILNVALFVILRLRGVLNDNPEAISPGPPIMVLGLITVLVAAFSLWRRRDVKRFFAYSTIEQSGVAAFAIGLGGPAATFAALLHITLHTLTKAAVFQCIGRAVQLKGSQRFSDIGGLLLRHPALGLTLAAGIVGVAGLPPFGLFPSEFLVITAAVGYQPWLVLPLGFGLVVGGWGLTRRLITLCMGAATPDRGPPPGPYALLPAWVHLGIVLVLGLAMPAGVAAWFTAIAEAAP
ncbi:Hydrogenase-4 component F homolog [Rhodovastum atsumiense]|uniref:Hydrogenase 4 subunit F n=1 Tax=Rhodovastum atsumiense TaxID=504468 RepID=A0A5M6IYQ3_9PROT|nr:hydrogenase 4 subunit F [Rhodovastum atsumiense]KAA5612947.1 hydrogenase 4 subunit F [Rhodovastum atsumiense]CAH2600961.1 Hydrogenase-4 component F homolog [Rhodovastum atsumiense]